MRTVKYTELSLIVTLNDNLDTHTVSSMRPFLETLVNNPERPNVVMDMSDVLFLDSAGIGALVFLFKRLAEQGRHIHLVGLSGQPNNIIRNLKIDRTLKIHENLNTYLTHERSKQQQTSVSHAKSNELLQQL